MMGFLIGTARVLAMVGGVAVLLLAAGYVFERVGAARDAQAFPPPGRMVEVGGQRLHLLCKGDAPGPIVILEMGAAEPSPLWWSIQDQVAPFARVCSYDRAGFGWSDPVKGPRSLEDRVADLHLLLKTAKVPGPYVMVGHSYGGPLVRLFARDYPTEVAGMVLVDTPDETSMFRGPYLDFVRTRIKPILGVLGFARRFGVLRLWEMISGDGGMTQPGELGGDAKKALAATSGTSLFRAASDEMDSVLTAPPALRKPGGMGASLGDRPLVVIRHGKAFPPPFDVLEVGWEDGQRRLAALSSDGVLIVAKDSNHMVQMDEPDVVVDAIHRVHTAARDGTKLSAP